jgi:hypothetical protein
LRDEFCIGIKNSEREYLITQTAAAEIQSRQRREAAAIGLFFAHLSISEATAERPNFDWKGDGIFSLLVAPSFEHCMVWVGYFAKQITSCSETNSSCFKT